MNEIVLLQGAQSDLLSIYAVHGERTYLRQSPQVIEARLGKL